METATSVALDEIDKAMVCVSFYGGDHASPPTWSSPNMFNERSSLEVVWEDARSCFPISH